MMILFKCNLLVNVTNCPLGFDKQGAEQLACKLINTRKWIGATEIATVLRSLGLR